MDGCNREVVDSFSELLNVVVDPDAGYHLRELLVGTPFLKIVIEGPRDCSDMEGEISWLLPAGCHGRVTGCDRARVLQCADLCAVQLMHGPPVSALDLGCGSLLGHGDEAGLVEPFQDEVGGLRGDPAPELDSACVLEIDRCQA